MLRVDVLPKWYWERVINHSKDVLEETYDPWDYFDEKRDALERLERYLHGLRATRAKRKTNASHKPSIAGSMQTSAPR
jgi:hypothetical protein